jgi:membrane protein implicated in regulation of membrane protease activity
MNFDPVLVWFLIGLVLVLSEFMLPGVILIFFGAGCWVTALTTWLGMTGGMTSQLLVFAISSVLMLTVLRRWFRSRLSGYLAGSQDPEVNLDDLAGEVVTVTTTVSPGNDLGRVLYKGAEWKARSEVEIAAGSRAVITAAEGITLLVRPEQ